MVSEGPRDELSTNQIEPALPVERGAREQGKVVQLVCPLCDHWRGNGGGCSGKERCDAFDRAP